jgi:hypothetical protein
MISLLVSQGQEIKFVMNYLFERIAEYIDDTLCEQLLVFVPDILYNRIN